jgi:phage host-nuclease inhibitor protein Gam
MSKNTRIKAESDITSKMEFEQTLDLIAEYQLKRDAMVVDRDAEILAAREKFGPQIETIEDRMKALVLSAEKYATIHRETLFGKLKSAATALTVYGFRTGNPTLKLLNKKWSWETVLEALKATAWGRQFLVTKESVDKDVLKAQADDVQLATVGCRVEQTEAFFVEPKRDQAADQRIVADGKAVAA